MLTRQVTADTITDEQIRELLDAGLISEWVARAAFSEDAIDHEISSSRRDLREYVADVFNDRLAAVSK